MVRRPTKTFDPFGAINTRLPKPLRSPQIDPQAFDEFIQDHGLRWKHEKTTFCPNVRDLDAQDHDPNCRGCDRGYLFFDPTEILGVFSQNKLEKMYDVQGVWDIGQAVVTFQAFMNGVDGTVNTGPAVDFQIGDRITCIDYTFTWTDLVVHNIATGIDRLRYPAVTVEGIFDKGKRYREGSHFKIRSDGQIEWLTQERPKFQQNIQKGGVYAIRYTARPVFFVTQMLHEIRATKGQDQVTGEVVAVRLPQQVLLRRDFLVQNEADKIGQQDVYAPRDGIIPPR